MSTEMASKRKVREMQAIKSGMRKSYTAETLPATYWDAIAGETSSTDDAHLDDLLDGREPRIFFPGDSDYPGAAAEDGKRCAAPDRRDSTGSKINASR